MMTEIGCTDPVTQSLIAWIAAVNQNLPPLTVSTSRLSEIRFEDLVHSLLDLEWEDAARIDSLADSRAPLARAPAQFFEILQLVIRQHHLSGLFATTAEGEYHRSICPAAYNERTGEHFPEEMARWRADFRAMSPQRQMMAATIVWMYRAGPDSIWLRRVPCTWRASEALHYMRDAGCLAGWLKLVARYPGW